MSQQLDRAGRLQDESLGVRADDLDAEPHTTADDCAADRHLGPDLQTPRVKAADLEAHRGPGLTRLDVGERREHLLRLGPNVDPGAPRAQSLGLQRHRVVCVASVITYIIVRHIIVDLSDP